MLLKVDCLPNAVAEAAVHAIDQSWKKVDVKLMMTMVMIVFLESIIVHISCNKLAELRLRMKQNHQNISQESLYKCLKD